MYQPPDTEHPTGVMGSTVYSLKILLVSSKLKLTKKDKGEVQDVWLFVMTSCVKPWIQGISAFCRGDEDM